MDSNYKQSGSRNLSIIIEVSIKQGSTVYTEREGEVERKCPTWLHH